MKRIIALLLALASLGALLSACGEDADVYVPKGGAMLEEGEEPESYDITGSTEADMNLNRISDESPVGAALIGHKPGDEVDVTLPNGSIVTYKLLTVTRSK